MRIHVDDFLVRASVKLLMDKLYRQLSDTYGQVTVKDDDLLRIWVGRSPQMMAVRQSPHPSLDSFEDLSTNPLSLAGTVAQHQGPR